MCDYCSRDTKERQAARERDFRLANELVEFAQALRNLTYARIDTHGDDLQSYHTWARRLIRELVIDWM